MDNILKILIFFILVILLIIAIKKLIEKKKLQTKEEIFFQDLKLETERIKKQMCKNIAKNKNLNSSFEESKLYKNRRTPKEIGDEYEEKVALIFEKQNFKVDRRGQRLGKKDKGIDLIAENDDKLYLIQCKYYKPSTKINHIMIKEFSANATAFLLREKISKKDIYFLLVFPNEESIEESAEKVFEDKSFNVNKLIIK